MAAVLAPPMRAATPLTFDSGGMPSRIVLSWQGAAAAKDHGPLLSPGRAARGADSPRHKVATTVNVQQPEVAAPRQRLAETEDTGLRMVPAALSL
jgi:hypothetical protein